MHLLTPLGTQAFAEVARQVFPLLIYMHYAFIHSPPIFSFPKSIRGREPEREGASIISYPLIPKPPIYLSPLSSSSPSPSIHPFSPTNQTNNQINKQTNPQPQTNRGEKTAQALEAHLSTLEKKIDDLLASFDEAELQRMDESSNGKESSQERRGAE
jgi:hypothetical protein